MKMENAVDSIVISELAVAEDMVEVEREFGETLTRGELISEMSKRWTESGRLLYSAGYLQALKDVEEVKH